MPFREAHVVVGRIVADCIRKGAALEDLTPRELTTHSTLFTDAPDDIASVQASVERRNVPGGTAKEAVLRQIEMARARL
jgi:argininosuccinate lyase